MNCKKGDLAIVVRSRNPENIGKIVTCLEFVPAGTYVTQHLRVVYDSWLVDKDVVVTRVKSGIKELMPYVNDKSLMPIRPDELDETEDQGEPIKEKA